MQEVDDQAVFPQVNGRIRNLLVALKTRLEVIYGSHLRAVYLYGSYARGEEDDESDVDVLVVLDRLEDCGTEIRRTSRAVSEISLRYEVSISRSFVREEDWSSAQTSFLADVREDAVPV